MWLLFTDDSNHFCSDLLWLYNWKHYLDTSIVFLYLHFSLVEPVLCPQESPSSDFISVVKEVGHFIRGRLQNRKIESSSHTFLIWEKDSFYFHFFQGNSEFSSRSRNSIAKVQADKGRVWRSNTTSFSVFEMWPCLLSMHSFCKQFLDLVPEKNSFNVPDSVFKN